MFSSRIKLTTSRLTLKPLGVKHAQELFCSDVQNEEICKYMTWEPHTKIEETIDFLKSVVKNRKKETGLVFGIFIEKKLIGLIGIDDITKKINACTVNHAEIGYWIMRKYWGQGIMTEAVSEVIKYAFTELKLHKLHIGHFTLNKASEKVIQKMGFTYIEEQKKHYFKNGVWYDRKTYEMLEEDYFQRYTLPS